MRVNARSATGVLLMLGILPILAGLLARRIPIDPFTEEGAEAALRSLARTAPTSRLPPLVRESVTSTRGVASDEVGACSVVNTR